MSDAVARWPLVTAAEMRALEAQTVKERGVSLEELMERAGQAVATEALDMLDGAKGPVLVACGPGNNGGDGLIAARLLHQQGIAVSVWPLYDLENFRGELVRQQWQSVQKLDIPVLEAAEHTASCSAPPWEDGDTPRLIIDALFGIGVSRRARDGVLAYALEQMARASRAHGAQVLAVDMPSGISADTGLPHESLEPALAARTITFGFPKLGHALEPGRHCSGEVKVARLGIVSEAPEMQVWVASLNPAGLFKHFPERNPAAHKGDHGHLLVIAGSVGKTGAAALVARGAHRVGAGLVTLACPESINAILEVKCTEAMTAPLPETGMRTIGPDAVPAVLELAKQSDALVIGPGHGRAPETFEFVRALLAERRQFNLPIVLDADGLMAFAETPETLAADAEQSQQTILTPHPGEAAALLHTTASEVNADRVAAARKLAAKTSCLVVLKGAGTVLVHPDTMETVINLTGGPALAAGGSGDVLAGAIGGLLGQQAPTLSAIQAAALGVWLHGAAADRLERQKGPAGVLASEVADEIPITLKEAREQARTQTTRALEDFDDDDVLDFPEPR